MARFVFRLDSVLEQRRGAERAAQRIVAALERHRLDLEGSLRDIQDQIVREKEDLRAHLSGAPGTGPVQMRHVRLQAGASLRLVGKAHHAAIQLAGVLARLEGARRDLMAATTRRKAVETLRERRWSAWKEAGARREDADLDELAVMSAARQEAEA